MPIKTTNEFGPRHYYDTSNPAVHYPSVTSITGHLPKDLTKWHANMAAARAIDSLSYLPQMVDSSPKHAAQYIASAAGDHMTAAQDKGSAGHDVFERMLKGMPVDLPETAEQYKTDLPTLIKIHDAFADFLDRTQPELIRAEDVAWSDEHGYAGSFDVAWRFKGNPETGELDPQGEWLNHLSDYKTGKNIYPSVAVQLVAYANAERVTSFDGGLAAAEPMPTFQALSVLHINEKVTTLKPIRKSVWGPAWRTFLACIEFQRAAVRWGGHGWGRNRIKGHEDDAFGSSLFTKSGRLQTGTERRA